MWCTCEPCRPALPSPPPSRVWPETGLSLDLSHLSSIASAELEQVLRQSLADPEVQASLQLTLSQALEAPAVKASLRPYLIEAALWAAGAVAAGVALGRLVTR